MVGQIWYDSVKYDGVVTAVYRRVVVVVTCHAFLNKRRKH